MGESPAIEVHGLRKSYGSLEAVRGIDLAVASGEVFALLGPNGAGKTTTAEILEGHRSRSSGEVRVLGHDPAKGERAMRARIGIVLQSTGVEEYLTVREVVALHGGYYPRPRDPDEVVALVGLTEQADRRVRKLSGGQRRRLDLAVALAGDPELLFLDEPTTGFDPSARRQAWDMLRELTRLGKTIFLTTHFMDEAQLLADRVAVIANGSHRGRGQSATAWQGATAARRTSALRCRMGPSFPTASAPPARRTDTCCSTDTPTRLLHELTDWALSANVELVGLEVTPPFARGRLPAADGRGGPGTMNDLALAVRQVRYENRSFWRNPAAAFFTFAFPLLFMVIFNVIFGGETQGNLRASDFFTPTIIVFAVITATYTNIAMTVSIARDSGVLKRIRGTPLPAWAFLFGRIAHAVLIALLLVAIVAAFGALAYRRALSVGPGAAAGADPGPGGRHLLRAWAGRQRPDTERGRRAGRREREHLAIAVHQQRLHPDRESARLDGRGRRVLPGPPLRRRDAVGLFARAGRWQPRVAGPGGHRRMGYRRCPVHAAILLMGATALGGGE